MERWFLAGKYHLSAALVLAALVTGVAKILNGFAQSTVSALAEPRELSVVSLLGWVAVAIAVARGNRRREVGPSRSDLRRRHRMAGAVHHGVLRDGPPPPPAGRGGRGDLVSAELALALFQKSVLKQAKYRRITALLDDPVGQRCLDIGADNGVISSPAPASRRPMGQRRSRRAHGGVIRELVGDDVHQLDGARTPFADQAFDQVVVVDYLEHIADERRFAEELARILKPGGRVIINVPHLKPRSLLNRVRHAIGLTDEWHGHLRPGYSLEGLRALLGPRFTIEQVGDVFQGILRAGGHRLERPLPRDAARRGGRAWLLQGHGRYPSRHP